MSECELVPRCPDCGEELEVSGFRFNRLRCLGCGAAWERVR